MPSQSRITPDRAVLLGALVAALAYIQDVRYDFILDDVPLILLNDTITSLRNWKSAFVTQIFAANSPTAPQAIAAVHYRPVYKLWQMLNEQLFGSSLPWWHITSLLLHVGVIFLVYQLGVKLLKERWTAALAALIFAFHPIHVESVTYVTASTDLLVTIFALISFLAYFRFREEDGSRIYLIVSVLAAALSMMSKETAVMFPWLLVAYEALREVPAGTQRVWKRYIWTLPFFAVVGAYVTVRTLIFGLNSGPGPGGSRIAALLDIPLVFLVYLRNLFWPFRLSFFYPAEWGSQWTVLKGAAFILVMVAAIFLWRRYRDRREVRLQLLWAAILLVPAVLGVYTFVREDWVHDRHMYLTSVPVCLILAALLTDTRLPAKASATVSSMILTLLLIATAVYVPAFSDNTTIYASALRVAPGNRLLHGFYAEALWSHGRHDEGLREFKITTGLAPTSDAAHEHYGSALAEIGRDDEAMTEFSEALRWSSAQTPFRAFILSELAGIELKRSEFPKAAGHLREALQISPQTLNYHAWLAQALSQQGLSKEADEEMRVEAGIRQRFVRQQRTSRN
jgi:Flp pilus assembly protein TadD